MFFYRIAFISIVSGYLEAVELKSRPGLAMLLSRTSRTLIELRKSANEKHGP